MPVKRLKRKQRKGLTRSTAPRLRREPSARAARLSSPKSQAEGSDEGPVLEVGVEKRRSGLTQNQKLYFFNGWCFSVLLSEGNMDFPFRSKREYRTLHFKYRSEIVAAINIPTKDRAPFEDMDWDRLRPAAWWELEDPGKNFSGITLNLNLIVLRDTAWSTIETERSWPRSARRKRTWRPAENVFALKSDNDQNPTVVHLLNKIPPQRSNMQLVVTERSGEW